MIVSWDEVSWSNTIFRLYHFVRILITIVQTPLRAHMLYNMKKAGKHTEDHMVINDLLLLSEGTPWELNRQLGLVIHSIFFFGVSLIVGRMFFFEPHHHLNWCLMINIVIFVAHLLYSFMGIRDILGNDDGFDTTISASGASVETISKHSRTLQWEDYVRSQAQKNVNCDDEECPICFCEYEGSDSVRVLNCDHVFHGLCIDKWLQGKDICPVCTSPITSPKSPEKFHFPSPASSPSQSSSPLDPAYVEATAATATTSPSVSVSVSQMTTISEFDLDTKGDQEVPSSFSNTSNTSNVRSLGIPLATVEKYVPENENTTQMDVEDTATTVGTVDEMNHVHISQCGSDIEVEDQDQDQEELQTLTLRSRKQ